MASSSELPVFFFDIDNCLYSRSKRVHDMMTDLINAYFREHLEITLNDAQNLREHYYEQYGLAIDGLVRHHKIEPLEYNRKVDDALSLEDVLSPDPALRELIEAIDTTKCKLWLFTNAYSTHGHRVIRLLGLEGLFAGMTFCDYAEFPLVCKPKPEAYERAMRDAGITDKSKCYFIDDSASNCQAALEYGWTHVVHKLEPEDSDPEFAHGKYHIRDLSDLKALFPEIFKS